MRAEADPDTAQAVHPSPPLTSDPDAKCRLWRSFAASAESSAFLPPSLPPPRLCRRSPFVYPSGAFNGRENTALSTGCWRTRSSPKGAPVVSNNFCSRMAALLSLLLSLPFSSNSSSTKRTLFFVRRCGSGGAVTALLAGGPSGLLAVPLLWTSLLGPIL